jgi:hypothetical protein
LRGRIAVVVGATRGAGRLADQLRDTHGCIDILVNDIWGAERLKGGPPDRRNIPFWQHA